MIKLGIIGNIYVYSSNINLYIIFCEIPYFVDKSVKVIFFNK